jgi:hypothetical protein
MSVGHAEYGGKGDETFTLVWPQAQEKSLRRIYKQNNGISSSEALSCLKKVCPRSRMDVHEVAAKLKEFQGM